MLTDDQNLELCNDIKEFIENYENEFLYKNPSNEDKETYKMLMDSDNMVLPNGKLWFQKESIACRSLDFNLKDEIKLFHEWYGLDYEPPRQLKQFYWMTLTGKSRIPDTTENIELMLKFGKALFNNDNYKRFHKVYWNIETGKHKDNPNLHLHALICFDTTSKNFHSKKEKSRSDVKTLWNKYFKSYGLDYGNDSYQYFKGKDIEKIYNDKLKYLKNEDKSILHKNYRDLEILIEL